MNWITTGQLANELDKSRNSILVKVKSLKLNVAKGGNKPNSPLLFTEKQAEKIRESFK